MAEIRQISWTRDSLLVLDQRLLPRRAVFVRCATAQSVAKAIRDMTLRGAPLIGAAAAYGYALAAKKLPADRARWPETLRRSGRVLRAARPTAVNLMRSVDRMQAKADALLAGSAGARSLYRALKAEADAVFAEDAEANRRMGDIGAGLLEPGSTVITYCNTGALATCGIGTALGIIRRAHELGNIRHVYPCETRPYLQGSRLTLWELMRLGIPSTLITDNMAAHLMATRHIDAVFVGSDRIAANADVANKIGTYGLAILARHHRVPFYVVAPTTTVDLETPSGKDIPIEERSGREVVEVFGSPIAPKGARARHPAFDVTPHELVTAIITERGIVAPADAQQLERVVRGRGI